MSAPSQSLQFICRSCRQSLSRPSSQVRAFSNSTSRAKTIPSFQPTSSPELDALFLDWRQRVFTPAALNKTHQALVFKKSRHAILEQDPGVTVTMSDGEEVKLQPMDRWHKPNKLDSLHKIAELLSNTTDAKTWSQLPVFLEGMALAKLSVPSWWLEKITRKANEQGRAKTIKQCAMMVKNTGLSLSTKVVTKELFLGCHMRLVEAQLAEKSAEDEYQFAKDLTLLLEKDEHCGGLLKESKDTSDMRRDLTVLGVLLETAAVQAIDVHNKRDAEGEVGGLCRKFIAMTGFRFVRDSEKKEPGKTLENWIPLANGIRLALEVRALAAGEGKNAEANLRTALQDRLIQLERVIEEESEKLRAEANGAPRRALQMLEKMKQSQD